jgi:hypothetical protein
MTRILYIGGNKDGVCMLIRRLTRQGFDIGCDDHDAKPIVFERLLEKIGALTLGRSLQ